jgi:hypothetical protein
MRVPVVTGMAVARRMVGVPPMPLRKCASDGTATLNLRGGGVPMPGVALLTRVTRVALSATAPVAALRGWGVQGQRVTLPSEGGALQSAWSATASAA